MDLTALTTAFEKEARFADGYSDTYQAIFEIFAEWGNRELAGELVEGDAQTAIRWLAEAAGERIPFEISLLTMAGLHELVLEGAAPDLARYYPSAGGTLAAQIDDQSLRTALAQTILTHQKMLQDVLQHSMVQTNETGRGLVWLLPLSYTGWAEVDLLDLGASAGLNLFADQRGYRLKDERHVGEDGFRLGSYPAVEFESEITGRVDWAENQIGLFPTIRRRVGCDMAPFLVNSPSQAHRLQSYIWADQLPRIERLKRGLTVLEDYKRDGGRFELHPVTLPYELAPFLERQFSVDKDGVPLVIYNTFVTQYFRDQRTPFIDSLTQWASNQLRPILWLQWEPPLSDREGGMSDENQADDARRPSEFGWLGWDATLWQAGQRHAFHLGWTHPHGKGIRMLPDFQRWQAHFG